MTKRFSRRRHLPQVIRGEDGELCTYPVVETVQVDNVCHTTLAPARVSPESAAQTVAAARKAVESLWGAGAFGVELFLMRDGGVLLNEIAPRCAASSIFFYIPTHAVLSLRLFCCRRAQRALCLGARQQ